MGIMYKKISLFWGDFSIAVFTLSACAKPKLDAKLSVNDIIYMSRRALKLKDDQTLVEASFKREQISEDMKNEPKTSTKQFYLKDEDDKKVTASKIDKDDLPTLFTKNNNIENATDDFGKVEANDYKTSLSFSKWTTIKNINSILNQKMERQRDRLFQLVQKISMVKQLPMLKKMLMLILTQFF